MSNSIKNVALSAALVLSIAIFSPALAEQNADSSQQDTSMMQDDMSDMGGMDGMMPMMEMMAEMQPMMETCNAMMKAMMARMGDDAIGMQPDSMSTEPPVNG